jgi:hypothetical protein
LAVWLLDNVLQARARDSPNNGERYQVTKTLDDIKSMGMTVIRVWAFQDDPNNGQPVHKMVGKDASKCQAKKQYYLHGGSVME